MQILRNGIFQGPHPLKIKNCGPHPENFQTHGPNPNVELAYETNGHAASLGWEKKKVYKVERAKSKVQRGKKNISCKYLPTLRDLHLFHAI